jgi:hypothetical protein
VTIQATAFRITAGFEGRSYGAMQTNQRDQFSYGLFQFTGGALAALIDRYLGMGGILVPELRTYVDRLKVADPTLRTDVYFHTLLLTAADDRAMRIAQDSLVVDRFWEPCLKLSIDPRGIVTALGQAFLFDCAIQHGLYHDLIQLTETILKVPFRSRVDDNGVSEQKLIAAVARQRDKRLRTLAFERHLGGLIPRAEFWMGRVAANDWNLEGTNGFLQLRALVKVVANDSALAQPDGGV